MGVSGLARLGFSAGRELGCTLERTSLEAFGGEWMEISDQDVRYGTEHRRLMNTAYWNCQKLPIFSRRAMSSVTQLWAKCTQTPRAERGDDGGGRFRKKRLGR